MLRKITFNVINMISTVTLRHLPETTPICKSYLPETTPICKSLMHNNKHRIYTWWWYK